MPRTTIGETNNVYAQDGIAAMTTRFPDTMTFTGWDAPARIEADVYDLEVYGEIPKEINGTWYRCGPDPQYPPFLGDDIYINGDGMVTMFRFENGHVDLKQRYVRTERFLAERKARRSLFGLYRNVYTDAPEAKGLGRGTANTTTVFHGGRLFALKEDSLPMELDPDTLETRGEWTWGGKLKSKTVSAHPKIDPETGELLFYGYEASGDGSTDIAFCVANKEGELVREEWFQSPYPAMVHDFAITRDHVIFPIFPTLVDMDRLKAGGLHWMSDLSKDTYVGVMPRSGTVADIKWFRRPGGHAYHVINAFDEGDGRVCLDLALSEINPFPYVPDVSGAPYDPMKAASVSTRWTMDMSRNDDTLDERPLGPVPGDVPRVDDRRVGLPYRYGYMGQVDPFRPMVKAGPVGAGFNQIGQLDVQTGQNNAWFGADTDGFEEPQFIPTGPNEDDGYVVAVIERHDRNTSDIGIWDAKRFADGPVAYARVPFRLRLAFHGCWVPAGAR